MTPMDRFRELLDKTFENVAACWDRGSRSLNTEQMESLLGVASSGERHMALFFRDLWFGHGHEEPFILVEAIGSVGRDQEDLIRHWLSDPFWP